MINGFHQSQARIDKITARRGKFFLQQTRSLTFSLEEDGHARFIVTANGRMDETVENTITNAEDLPNLQIELQEVGKDDEITEEINAILKEFANSAEAHEHGDIADQDDAADEENSSSQPNSQEMDKMILDASAKSTHRSTNWGINKLNQWAVKNKRQVDLTTISVDDLNEELRRFYAGVKSNQGNALTPSALTGIRAAIHRSITTPPLSRNINILSDKAFTTSNQMFLARCRLYYKAGNKRPTHKPAIESGDMKKLAIYFKNWNADPSVLIEYVWFCLCYYFGRRGREGWRDFTKTSFKVSLDDKNREFIHMAHTDLTKNHRGGHKQHEQDYSTQKVYGSSGKLNIIEAYKFYLTKLNPNCKALFQTPLPNYDADSHWYKNEPMGKNTLGNLMKRLSKKAGLSQDYTAHSVRASTVTILGHAGVQPMQICNITKHKNELSLKHYCTDMSNDQKQECSNILSKALVVQDPDEACHPVQGPPHAEDPDITPKNVIAEQLADGSYAITIPSTVPQQSALQPHPVAYNSVENTATDMKYLQNVLPHCKFESCTININTSEKAIL